MMNLGGKFARLRLPLGTGTMAYLVCHVPVPWQTNATTARKHCKPSTLYPSDPSLPNGKCLIFNV